MRLVVRTSLFVLFLFIGLLPSQAQVTTSGLSGHVTDSKKEGLVGATVQATYKPTGTKYAAVTDVDGRFRINNMNAGGPYEIVITYVSYKDETRSDIVLQLGETTNLTIVLQDASTQLSEIVVKGDRAGERQGAGINVNSETIGCISNCRLMSLA